MKITERQLEGWNARSSVREWFLIRFPEKEAKYQDVLTALANDDRPDEACWLMDIAGADDCGCLCISALETHKHVFAAGKLSVSTSLSISGWIRAELSIEADMSLSADLGIVAGCNIRTGGSLRTNGEIKAGTRIDAGRNISAGHHIRSAYAIVSGGDIRAGMGINAGMGFDLMVDAVEALNSEEPDESRKILSVIEKLWATSSGSKDYWDAIVGDHSPFGLEAAGDIFAGESIASTTKIKAGESITAAVDLHAGRTIFAGGNITAGQSINASWELFAEGGIQAGTDIVAARIHAQGGIKAGDYVLFTLALESGADICASGNIRGSRTDVLPTILAKGELRGGKDVRCDGEVLAARIDVCRGLVSGRSIRADGDIIVGNELNAGREIKSWLGNICAGSGIKAGGSIQAAQGIQAAQEVVAGEDCGVFAGTGVALKDWETNARVIAKTKPENLISGYWVEKTEQKPTEDTANNLPLKSVQTNEWCIWGDGPEPPTNIRVIGIGGMGARAVNHMNLEGACGSEFMVADTDLSILQHSVAKQAIHLDFARFANSNNPETTGKIAKKDHSRICEFLKDAQMVLIVVGMGGQTGTWISPIVARIAHKLGIFTVAVVTRPFSHEESHIKVADAGIAELKKYADSLIVLHSDTLLDKRFDVMSIDKAFKEAGSVLRYAVGGIADIINGPGFVNPFYKDVCAVLGGRRIGMVGLGHAAGVDRARIASERALASPLLKGTNFSDADGVLVIITTSRNLRIMKEVNDVLNTVRDFAADDANIAFGTTYDESCGEDISVILIAMIREPSHHKSIDADR